LQANTPGVVEET